MTLHWDGFCQLDHPPSTGQGCVLQTSLLVDGPGHLCPPGLGDGWVQVRAYDFTPPPHVTLQLVCCHLDQPPSTGHGFVLQVSLRVDIPIHCWPPRPGGGFVHVLARTLTPPPHETLHFDCTFHRDHPPFTGQSLVLQGTLWVDTPEHCWPPERGGGLSQYLTCTFTPPPHETLHLDWVCHLDQPPLTGHEFVLQGSIFVDNPEQKRPPLAGDGLLQVRVLLFIPPPHVTLHVD